jgi:uncharacterized protein (DUF58 family)
MPRTDPAAESGGAPARRATWFERYLYRNYRALSAISFWLELRFTPAGLLVFCSMVAAGGLGLDTSLTMAHQVFALLFCALVIAWLARIRPRARFRVQRQLPRNGSVGSPLGYEVIIGNLSRRRQREVEFREGIPDARPSRDEFVRHAEPDEEKRNWFDRRYRFYRWRWLQQRNQRATAEAVALPPMAPGAEVRAKATLLPVRRGRLTLAQARLTWTDPLGLLRAVVRVPTAPDSVLILPRRYRLPPIELPGSSVLQPGGVALAGTVGESEEFVALREYRAGDPLRRIHWPAWARTTRPVVKEFQEEHFVRHALVVDTFAPPAADERFEEAVSVAASFAATVDERESLLDLMFVGPRAFTFTAGRGLAHSQQMLEVLAAVELCGGEPFVALEDLVLGHAVALSGCICVLLSWDDRRRGFVDRLRALGLPVLVFVVSHDGPPDTMSAPSWLHWLTPGRVGEQLAGMGRAGLQRALVPAEPRSSKLERTSER